jgi:hypothetical protein
MKEKKLPGMHSVVRDGVYTSEAAGLKPKEAWRIL